MTWPVGDMYTVLERSVVQTIKIAIAAAGKSYTVFNILDKKKFPDQHTSVSIAQVTDSPNFGQGGGPTAAFDTVLTTDGNGNPVSFLRQPWPDSYDLMYQVEIESDNLADLRALEQIVRSAMRPRQVLKLWDSGLSTPAFGSEWVEYHYAGYINRDMPTDNIYNRIYNIRFDMKTFPPSVVVPAIIGVQTDQEVGGAPDTSVSVGATPRFGAAFGTFYGS